MSYGLARAKGPLAYGRKPFSFCGREERERVKEDKIRNVLQRGQRKGRANAEEIREKKLTMATTTTTRREKWSWGIIQKRKRDEKTMVYGIRCFSNDDYIGLLGWPLSCFVFRFHETKAWCRPASFTEQQKDNCDNEKVKRPREKEKKKCVSFKYLYMYIYFYFKITLR